MTSLIPTAKQLAELAKESVENEPIDWNQMQMSEDAAYELMASQVLEQISDIPENQQLAVCMATITKLLVENFAANIRLEVYRKQK